MIDKKEFTGLRKELADYDAARDKIIKESRDITKLSKQAIYSLHRGEMKTAKEQLADAERIINALLKEVVKDPALRTAGFSSGLEEYVEAKAFLHFLEKNGLMLKKAVPVVDAEEYLLGLCDLTGELVRHAVLRATKRDLKSVQRIRDLLDGIYGEFVQFDFRNSELRKKYDSIKYNLQKAENILYDLQMNPRKVKQDI